MTATRSPHADLQPIARRGHRWTCQACGDVYVVESGDVHIACLQAFGHRWRCWLECPSCGERDFRLVYESDGVTVVGRVWVDPTR